MLALLCLPMVLLLDYALGEPRRWHPLIGFGQWAERLELRLNETRHTFWKGVLAWNLAIVPIVLLIACLDILLGGWWLSLLCGWFAIGWNSLRQHGQWVAEALASGDMAAAREKASWLVSRDNRQANKKQISTATVESILENGSDAIFAPLFWLAVAGAPGVILYRLANTLDAMWGYRTHRYEQFGKFAARTDDVLNYIPARLTALTYAGMGHFTTAMKCWHLQAKQWHSPNAGVVMATGAGALQLALGGPAVYDGQLKKRPSLGMGKEAQPEDINIALALVSRSAMLWGGIALLLSFVFNFTFNGVGA